MLTSSNKQESFIERKNVEGIEVIYVRNTYDNSMGILSRLWSFFKFMIFSTWLGLKQEKIDLVYATSTPLTIGIPALFIKWLKRTKYVFEVRDLWPEVPIQMGAIKNKFLANTLYMFERKLYKSAKHIIALSPGMQNGIIKQGIAPKKITMIPNMAKKEEFYARPVNIDVARKFNLDNDNFKAIHFGAMGIANGLNYIIDAAVILSKNQSGKNIEIIFLGGGKTEDELKLLCKTHNLTNVKFLGRHSLRTVSEIVNLCHCSIVSFADIPILYTNSPNKLFDSLSAAKPIIVNSAGWTKDMVEDHNCGVYVNPQDANELANALIKMAEDQVGLKKMAENSRNLAERVYDKTILSKKFVSVLEENV